MTTLFHEPVGIRGLGLPEPHGLVCRCGVVVPYDDWHHHQHGAPTTRWTPDRSYLRVEWNGVWTEQMVMEAFEAFYSQTGSMPARMGVSPHVHRELTRTSQVLYKNSGLQGGGYQVVSYMGVPLETLYNPNESMDFLFLARY